MSYLSNRITSILKGKSPEYKAGLEWGFRLMSEYARVKGPITREILATAIDATLRDVLIKIKHKQLVEAVRRKSKYLFFKRFPDTYRNDAYLFLVDVRPKEKKLNYFAKLIRVYKGTPEHIYTFTNGEYSLEWIRKYAGSCGYVCEVAYIADIPSHQRAAVRDKISLMENWRQFILVNRDRRPFSTSVFNPDTIDYQRKSINEFFNEANRRKALINAKRKKLRLSRNHELPDDVESDIGPKS